MRELPLVSCIMPTYNRRKFVSHAIRYFQRQDYPNKELIVIDDGSDSVSNLIPDNQFIKYIRLKQKITLGEKLNMACANSSGSLIANWDDDDWYSPNRLKYQVQELTRYNTKVCGLNNLLYYDLNQEQAYEYTYPRDQKIWLLGSSLCYHRSHWENNKFEEINVGMDGLFVWRTCASQVTVLPDNKMAVHMIHDQNVSPKKTDGEWWSPYPTSAIKQIMQADLTYYKENIKPIEIAKTRMSYAGHRAFNADLPKVKNIYTCLVHERLDCVIDLVRNLHFQDPSSIIILFNGGDNFQLTASLFPFKDYGAVIYPKPFPVKHGYLHDFALATMQFALENFSFDIFTVVDSDQLAIQPGYSGFMGEFLSTKANIGLLSNRPERLTAKDTDVWTSIQPFKEYDLWKPLLKTFTNGEEKFVHWSFWPSTVFTYDAIKDLLKLFRTNNMLKQIMKQTKIWATEEIILPTLVSLLGYDIELNPCCHDFVSYQKTYSVDQLEGAIDNPKAFWMHPVSRTYDEALRKHARNKLHNYVTKPDEGLDIGSNSAPLLFSDILKQIENIDGWLSDSEAELIYTIALKACFQFPNAHIVEVGCYHGKATTILGSVARSFSDSIKVYGIDTHDGLLGSADQGLYQYPPSLQHFNNNMANARLSDCVVSLVGKSTDIEWQSPVSLLLIDGLHDYLNIGNDFWKFSLWVETGGYVAFHDYADYFPDVMAFVHELLKKESYKIVHQAGSLLVLQKRQEFIENFVQA
ncbi:MAG: glycosyltransferase [Mucilaginibacter sp.]|nr:glycosyltransferase [Mucilaginibacter sp.]